MLFLLLGAAASQTFLGQFEQQIDHNNASVGVFKQFYWEYDDFFDPENGIVILKMASETPKFDVSGDKDWMHIVAERFHAVVFTLQHRYYGPSQPFSDTSVEHLQYLTVEQALNDYKAFHDGVISRKTGAKLDKLPWVAVGGSYPGLLSALTRKQWPNDFAAAISSAGVVYANNDYTDFDLQDAISMGQECASVARSTRVKLTKMWETDKDLVMQLFGFPPAIGESDFDFQLIIAELFALGVQTSDRARLCDPLVDTLVTGADPVYVLARYAKEVFLGEDLGSWEDYAIPSLQEETAENRSASRCWFWQTCNELAYWQTWPGRVGLRSKILTKEGFEAKCKAVFGKEMHPDTDQWNKNHQVGKGSGLTHVIFTTDSQDPWTWACVTDDYEPLEDGNYVHTLVGKEVGHHREYNYPEDSDPNDLRNTRSNMLKILDQWIAEWRQSH